MHLQKHGFRTTPKQHIFNPQQKVSKAAGYKCHAFVNAFCVGSNSNCNTQTMIDSQTTLKERFGEIPKETGLTRKMRLHQGWWRTNVLNEPAGLHPRYSDRNVCNTILEGSISAKNFLTPNALKAVKETLASRNERNLGIIEEDRLFNNLLSSQPLCFNFFGELQADKEFGCQVLKTFYPDVDKLLNVTFEFAPLENFTKDNSAFDVAFEVETEVGLGIIGLECKYTDTFSYKPAKSDIFYGDVGNKNHDTYFAIHQISKDSFNKPYYEFVRNKDYNQLYRNQLIGEALLQNKKYKFVKTGLFCYHEDENAISAGNNFSTMLRNPDNFRVITYKDFISNVQQLNINWEQREWTMLLWARYCGTTLSKETTSCL